MFLSYITAQCRSKYKCTYSDCFMIINNESTLGHCFNQGLKVKYIVVSNEVYSTLIGMAPSFHFSIIWLTRREKGND